MVYFTRMGLPLWLPGFHFGMALMTRTASASISSLTFFNTLTLVILPSASTMNWTMTRPCVPAFEAASGYLTFSFRNFIISTAPPGNSGICSTTSKTPLGSASGVSGVKVPIAVG